MFTKKICLIGTRLDLDIFTFDKATKRELKGAKVIIKDLTDGSRLAGLMRSIQPDEVYNLGAQSHVRVSFDQPIDTANIVALGTSNILEAVRDGQQSAGKQIRFYQACSSEMLRLLRPEFRMNAPEARRSGIWTMLMESSFQ